MGKKYWLWKYVDDTLGVYHTHLVAGTMGGMMTGVFATTEGCAAFGLTNPGGAIDGNWAQVLYIFMLLLIYRSTSSSTAHSSSLLSTSS